nr:hypothetical protein [Tanacetum cinerariifolium]
MQGAKRNQEFVSEGKEVLRSRTTIRSWCLEKTAEILEGQARSDPGKTPKSRPPPERFLIEEDQARPDPGQSFVALTRPDPEPMHDKYVAFMYPHNLDAYTFDDQFFNDKPTKEEPDKINMETEVESMVTILTHQASSFVPPLSTTVIDLTPPKPQQCTTDSSLASRVSTLEQRCDDLEKKYKLQDQTTQALSSRIVILELRDLPHKINQTINEVVKEAIHVALQALLRDCFRELPEADMKEILHQRMFKSGSYKSLPEHVALYKALEASMKHANRDEFLAAKDKSQKRRPPPSSSKQKSVPHSEQPVKDVPIPDDVNISDSEDTVTAHLPKIKTKPDWLKPVLEEDIPETPEPDWIIPRNDLPKIKNNWANVLSSSYQDPDEYKLLRQTSDMSSKERRSAPSNSKLKPAYYLDFRADYNEYKISEANFKNLHPNDFEDLYLLHLQGQLNHLSSTDKVHLFNIVNLWIRNIVIRKYYTRVSKPRDIIYRDRNDQNKMVRETEVSTLEQRCDDLEKKYKLQDQTTQALSSWIFTLELRDLPHKINQTVNEVVKEAVHVALQALLQDCFRELPEADMKEILHQRMFESGSYKSLPEHVALYKALEAEAPPSFSKQKSVPHSKQPVKDVPIPDDVNISDSEDTVTTHLPKIKTKPDWLKPVLEEDIPETPKPDWIIPLNDLPKIKNNWANALSSSYQAPDEYKLLWQTSDMSSKERRSAPSNSKLKADYYPDFRADYNEYKISEANFKNLHPNDFEDLYLLHLQGQLNHLSSTDNVHLFNIVNLWIRNIVIRKYNFLFKEDYTRVSKPRDIIYRDRNDKKKMMRETKVHKFSDGTLTRILEKLDHTVKDFKLFKNNPSIESRIWSEDDRRRSKDFMEVIERRLKIKSIFQSIESFVSRRLRDADYRLIQRTK